MFSLSRKSPGDLLGSFQKTMVVDSLMKSILRRKQHDLTMNINRLTVSRAKAIWDFEGIFCSSRHIPGVRFAGLIHPGILGCAPSAEILAEWNRREGELISTTELSRIVAQPPEPQNVHAGSADDEIKAKVGKEGARTIPGRPEHGGNCDIKNLSRGSKVYLPVHVKGAKFSVGDLHFSRTFYAREPYLKADSKQRVMVRFLFAVPLRWLVSLPSSSTLSRTAKPSLV